MGHLTSIAEMLGTDLYEEIHTLEQRRHNLPEDDELSQLVSMSFELPVVSVDRGRWPTLLRKRAFGRVVTGDSCAFRPAEETPLAGALYVLGCRRPGDVPVILDRLERRLPMLHGRFVHLGHFAVVLIWPCCWSGCTQGWSCWPRGCWR